MARPTLLRPGWFLLLPLAALQLWARCPGFVGQTAPPPAASAARKSPAGLRAVALDDPAVAERLKAAQERIRVAKKSLDNARDLLLTEDEGFLDKPAIAEVLALFKPESAKAMRPLVDRTLEEVFSETSSAKVLTTLVSAMALARLPHEPAWRRAGDEVLRNGASCSPGQLVELAWAFATAGEQRPELFEALKGWMRPHAANLEEKLRKTFAWACAEVGEHATELFGEPATEAPAAASRKVHEALRQRGREGADVLLSDPLPVVIMHDVVTEEQGRELVALADEANIWRSSSRRGARSAEGVDALRTSQSAVLSSPVHMASPATQRLRAWAAKTFALPESYVEALQIVRYAQGEQYGAHVDWGQKQDASLWIGGQRTATALVYLNSVPEECGGQTSFPHLGLSVSPRAGSALLWPNVDESGKPMQLVEHQAMPVLCDVRKYAVNVWLRGQDLPKYGGAAP